MPQAAGPGEDWCETALAKVNLTLEIIARRPDGYSELASIIAFADLGETLTPRPAEQTGIAILGSFAGDIDPHDNTVLAADRAFRKAFPDAAPPLAYELVKEIPVAAGMGGGSADAAAALRALARFAGISASDPRLARIALGIGADVPVCLRSAPALVTGIGEDVADLPAMAPMPALLVNPRRQLSTAPVFAKFWHDHDPRRAARRQLPAGAREVVRMILSGTNDLEGPARALEPAIGEVLDMIAATAGCRIARMTGSGATCFGLYEATEAAEAAATAIARARPDWWVRAAGLG